MDHYSKKNSLQRNPGIRLFLVTCSLLSLIGCIQKLEKEHVHVKKEKHLCIALLNRADTLPQLDERLRLARKAATVAKCIQDDSLIAESSLAIGYVLSRQSADSVDYYLEKARAGFGKLHCPSRKVRSNAELIFFFSKMRNPLKTMNYILESERIIARGQSATDDYIFYYLHKARFYHSIGLSDSALVALNQADNLCNLVPETQYKPHLKTARAVVCSTLGDTRSTIAAYTSAVNELREQTIDKAVNFTNLGNCYVRSRQLDSAMHCYNQAKVIYAAIGGGPGKINKVNKNIAFEMLRIDPNISRQYFRQIDPDFLSEGDKSFYLLVKATLEDNHQSKIKQYEELINYAKSYAMADIEQECYHQLYQYYNKKSDYRNALIYLNASNELNDHIRGSEMTAKLDQLNFINTLKGKELNIKNQQEIIGQKNKAITEQRINVILLFLLMLIAVFIFVLIVKNYRKKARIAQLLFQQTKIEQELLVREVSPISLQLENAADILRGIKASIAVIDNSLKSNAFVTAKASINEWLISYKEHHTILEARKNSEHVFVERINKYPGLANTEKRIIVLIRQGYQSKEIADRINLAVNTVEIYRSKIRKKMNVPQGQQLNDYIKSM